MENVTTDAPKPNNTDNPLGSDSTGVFLVSLGLNAGLAFILLCLFSFLRPRIKKLYAPRLLLLDTMFPLGKLPRSCFAWFIPAIMANDDDIFFYAGMDAFVYIRFMKLCLKISLVLLPYGIAILLPLNQYGGMKLTGLEELTMSNIKEGSPKIWAHLIAVWAYTLIICYLLYEEWKVFVMYRQEFLSKGLCHQYAAFVSELPGKLQDEESMRSFVEDLFPGQVEDVAIVEDLHRWKKLIKEHDKIVLKLEKAKYKLDKNGVRPMHVLHCCGMEEVDSITIYENHLKILQEKLEDEMNKDHNILPCAFVIFKSLKIASIATQVLWDNAALKVNIHTAPEVKDVIWSNLEKGFISRNIRAVLIWILLFFLVFFWTIPTGIVSSLIALNNLQKVLPFLSDFETYPSFIRLVIQGFLSSVVLWLFYLVLPWVVRFLTELEGIRSRSEKDQLVVGRLFIFKVVNQFLFLAIAGSALKKLNEMIAAPKEIPDYLARTLPAQSTFFICWIMLYAFPIYSIELCRLVPLLLWPISKCFAETPREKKETWRPPRVYYDKLYADHLLVFMIGLSYSILAPLITPFVVLYFGIGYVVWTYQVLCVYIPTYNSGGQLWPVVFSRIIASLVIFHLLMIGIFGLKENYATTLLVLPLPAITIAFYFSMQQYYHRASAYLSQEMGSSLPEGSPRVLQKAAQSYVANHSLPPLQGLSTDHTSTEDLLEYEEIQQPNERTRLLSSPLLNEDERVDLVVL